MNVLVRAHTLSASIQSSLRFHEFASIWIIDYVIYLRFSYFSLFFLFSAYFSLFAPFLFRALFSCFIFLCIVLFFSLL